MKPEESSVSTTLLLEAVVLLIDPKLPWVCNIVGYLLQRKAFTLFREIALTGKVWFLYQHLLLHIFLVFC
jgi:ubiquitin-protein ligase E3 C